MDKVSLGTRSRQDSICKSLSGGLANEAFDNDAVECRDVIMMMNQSNGSSKTATSERRPPNTAHVCSQCQIIIQHV